ncbi:MULTISPECIES: hypothetical protein [unclassified Mesorhizobium]|nr:MULTISPECIES: hypothetical protein [unclassified Mesorhizobium]
MIAGDVQRTAFADPLSHRGRDGDNIADVYFPRHVEILARHLS